ncbi:hypothetical protein PoB_005201800 [Plakobranchus ocellatus]|uniref:Uncharacterized protein n=1 Tax=Plakobranchus ocellatus TaxID=259542 RepID=A0AAV4C3F2_9GAST|nr:hypothetical protein PoB_005201800 [Plakobranchus ocellatus]
MIDGGSFIFFGKGEEGVFHCTEETFCIGSTNPVTTFKKEMCVVRLNSKKTFPGLNPLLLLLACQQARYPSCRHLIRGKAFPTLILISLEIWLTVIHPVVTRAEWSCKSASRRDFAWVRHSYFSTQAVQSRTVLACTVADLSTGDYVLNLLPPEGTYAILIPEAVCLARLMVKSENLCFTTGNGGNEIESDEFDA